MQDGTPYQWVINQKYMELVEKRRECNGAIAVYTYITGKGQIYFLDKIKEQIAILGDRFCEV